jgi:hypothetical protein
MSTALPARSYPLALSPAPRLLALPAPPATARGVIVNERSTDVHFNLLRVRVSPHPEGKLCVCSNDGLCACYP